MTSFETPLNCGLIGINSHSRFVLEALKLRPNTRAVVATDGLSDSTCIALRSDGLECIPTTELLQREDLTIVFLGADSEFAKAVPVDRKNELQIVLIEPHSQRNQWLTHERQHTDASRIGLHLWQAHRSQVDYQRALHVIQRGEIGPLRRIRFEQRELSPWGLPLANVTETTPASDRLPAEVRFGVLATLGWDILDSMLELVSTPVRRVFARLNNQPLSFGATVGNSFSSGADVRCAAFIEFANGCVGEVEIDLASAIPECPRWLIQADRGGYQTGRMSLTVEDGELFEEPVEVTHLDALEALLQRVQQPTSAEATRSRYEHWAAVERVHKALRDSAACGEVIELE